MRTLIRFGLFAIALLLSACSGSPLSEQGSPDSARQCPKYGESSFAYADLGLQRETEAHAPIAALSFNPNNMNLLIAYTFAQQNLLGELVEVRISDLQPVRSVRLARLTPGLTLFTQNADRILSAEPKTCEDKRFAEDGCWDVHAWSTVTGLFVDVPNGSNTGLTNLAISGDGQWLLKTGTVLGSLHNLDDQTIGATISDGFEGVRRSDVTGALTKHANLVALGIRDETWSGKFVAGWVRLEVWDGKIIKMIFRNGGWFGGPKDLTILGREVDGVPLRLAFDPTDQWLAAQTESSIYLFDVPSFGILRGRVETPYATLGVLRFNPLGTLLAVGHSQGMKVYTIPELRVASDKLGTQTTAIAFSPDGCLLAWGDTSGTVQIINSPTR